MDNIFQQINNLSEKYKNYTAENLSKLVKIKSVSLEEKGVQLELKRQMEEAGFDLVGADAAIVPVMLYDAKLSQDMANALLKEGIYVIGFFFPVVPKEKARIRVQLSAAHTKEHLDKAITAFIKVGKKLEVI